MKNLTTALLVVLATFLSSACAAGPEVAEAVLTGKQYELVAKIKARQKAEHGDLYVSQSRFFCVYALSVAGNDTAGDTVAATRCEDTFHSSKGKSLYSFASVLISRFSGNAETYLWTDIDPSMFQFDESKGIVKVLGMTWTPSGFWNENSDVTHWKDSYRSSGSSSTDSLYLSATTSGVGHETYPGGYRYEYIETSTGGFHGKYRGGGKG